MQNSNRILYVDKANKMTSENVNIVHCSINEITEEDEDEDSCTNN